MTDCMMKQLPFPLGIRKESTPIERIKEVTKNASEDMFDVD